ncbi:HAD family hydrolase [Corynebacterium zhongnanshanii]|uniref:HAD family hydrolase n=2 Tax=Corynebacterium zhongnanshanii TaxID=2768834 RepID=A0ABQ6VGQ0_9CORY|nr:HAD family hydrolase [Corynebacterium zhongnanshanii]
MDRSVPQEAPPAEPHAGPSAEPPAEPPLLVVSDIDGTLVDSRERVSPRMRELVVAMKRAGTVFTLASGRPARWLLPILEQLPVRPVCVCANGAVTYDSATDTVLHARTLAPEVMSQVVETIAAHYPQLGFGVERAGAGAFDADGNLFAVSRTFQHVWAEEAHVVEPMDQLTGTPATKLLVRSPNMTSAELFELVNPLVDHTVANVTYSWDGGLVEIAAPGVSKRLALEELAADLGVDRRQVVAFGDMPNDVDMIRWAGWGVAMGNADASLSSIADEITTTNDDDGVARVLSRWFSADSSGH